MSILPPELDANYELLEEMHEGGMGAVYKARHRHLDEPCVIKVMHSRLNDVSGAKDRFFREAKRGKQLRHQNIAEVLAFFVASDGKAYLVVEYVDGQNLRELLVKEGPLQPRLVVTIGVQALRALACLHSRQVIHRDISPDNLMLTTDGTGAPLVKLIDLGIAKSLDETMSLTGTGDFVGKVSYAAPEQFRETVDARSDLYSLGVVLYELATGVRPSRKTDRMAIIAASLSDEPARPFTESDPNGRVPSTLRTVILKALEKNPANRFQTADDFAEALQRSLPADHTTVVNSPLPITEPADAAILAPVLTTAPEHGPVLPPTVAEHGAVPPTVQKHLNVLPRVAIGTVLFLALGAIILFRRIDAPRTIPETTAVVSAAAAPATEMTVTAASATETTVSVPPATEMTVTAPPPVTVGQQQSAAEAIARGKRLASQRKMQEAYAAFDEATQLDPLNAFAWANFGGAAALLNKPEEARGAYERAIAVDPTNWLAHYNLACQLTRAGTPDEAFQHLEISIAQLKREARSRDQLASVMSSIRRDEALGALRDDSRFTKLLALE